MQFYRQLYIALLIICLASACTKTDVTFGSDEQENDPDIAYFDNYPVDISTYKVDSFVTSGHSVFSIGHTRDTGVGTITGSSYAELQLPILNDVKDKDVSFDSLVVVLTPNGGYYGDTLQPFHVRVHRLQEKIENEDASNTNFYNTRRMAIDASPLGQMTTTVRPKRGTSITIRLSDVLGAELLSKLKTNAAEIRTQDDFVKYIKGLYLSTDSTISKAMYFFSYSSVLMRLHYKLNGVYAEEKYIDFGINTIKQFNHLFSHHTGTAFSVFTPNKTQVRKSSLTGNRALLHSNMGSYIRITFPTLLSLKELHPYVKVIKAELVLKPRPGTFGYPYTLPPALRLYATDVNNTLGSVLLDNAGQNVLTGNLYIDDLYGDKTQYSYDITGFISNLIAEGQFSDLALMLTPPSGLSDSNTDRLVINDQQVSNGIQLKLYVLGL